MRVMPPVFELYAQMLSFVPLIMAVRGPGAPGNFTLRNFACLRRNKPLSIPTQSLPAASWRSDVISLPGNPSLGEIDLMSPLRQAPNAPMFPIQTVPSLEERID